MPSKQFARGIFGGFGTLENPFQAPNGMEENLRLIDDHLALYTISGPQEPGTAYPDSPPDGLAQIYTDGSYAVFNDGAWRAYPPMAGLTATVLGAGAWRNTGTGWEDAVPLSSLIFTQEGAGAVGMPALIKMRELYSVYDFGAVRGGGTSDAIAIRNTRAFQDAVDEMYFERGGGTVEVPGDSFMLAPSDLRETYDNDGVAVPASGCAVVQRKGVSIVGKGRNRSRLYVMDNTLIVVAMVAPERCTLEGLELHAAWASQADGGAGHGVFTLGTAGGADRKCRMNTWRDLYIHNVASYGIGLQNGQPFGCGIEMVLVEDIGADGLDLKARGDSTVVPCGNHTYGITVRNHGQRVTGSAGIDTRGIWHHSQVDVVDFGGGEQSFDYVGVRFRTKSSDPDQYPGIANHSTINGFFVRPVAGVSANCDGIVTGSDGCGIAGGTIVGGRFGVASIGNATGSATKTTIDMVKSFGASQYGFYTSVGSIDTIHTACISSGSGIAGFRDESTRSKYIACVADEAVPLSTSSGAISTQVVQACSFGADSALSITTSIAGRLDLTPRGTSPNIDVNVTPKGSGLFRISTALSSNGDMLVKDITGQTVHLMTRQST